TGRTRPTAARARSTCGSGGVGRSSECTLRRFLGRHRCGQSPNPPRLIAWGAAMRGTLVLRLAVALAVLDLAAHGLEAVALHGAEAGQPAVTDLHQRPPVQTVDLRLAVLARGHHATLAQYAEMARYARARGVAEFCRDPAGQQLTAVKQQVEDLPPRRICDGNKRVALGHVRSAI